MDVMSAFLCALSRDVCLFQSLTEGVLANISSKRFGSIIA